MKIGHRSRRVLVTAVNTISQYVLREDEICVEARARRPTFVYWSNNNLSVLEGLNLRCFLQQLIFRLARTRSQLQSYQDMSQLMSWHTRGVRVPLTRSAYSFSRAANFNSAFSLLSSVRDSLSKINACEFFFANTICFWNIQQCFFFKGKHYFQKYQQPQTIAARELTSSSRSTRVSCSSSSSINFFTLSSTQQYLILWFIDLLCPYLNTFVDTATEIGAIIVIVHIQDTFLNCRMIQCSYVEAM